MKRQARVVARKEAGLEVFYARYSAVLEAVASRVHALVNKGQKYTSATQLAEWISYDLPTLYRQTFGSTPRPLRVWRVKTMLANANYLGAFEALDVRSVRGQGVTTVVKPRGVPKASKTRGKLRVIRGGKR